METCASPRCFQWEAPQWPPTSGRTCPRGSRISDRTSLLAPLSDWHLGNAGGIRRVGSLPGSLNSREAVVDHPTIACSSLSTLRTLAHDAGRSASTAAMRDPARGVWSTTVDTPTASKPKHGPVPSRDRGIFPWPERYTRLSMGGTRNSTAGGRFPRCATRRNVRRAGEAGDGSVEVRSTQRPPPDLATVWSPRFTGSIAQTP